MLVERLRIRVSVVEGEADNIKITTPADLDRAQVNCRTSGGAAS